MELVEPPSRPMTPRIVDFYRRLDTGFGQFLTAEEIQRRGAPRLSDLLESMPGMKVVNYGTARLPFSQRFDCCRRCT